MTQRPDDQSLRARGRTPVSDEEKAKIVELAGQGMSRAEIARRTGRSPSTVGLVAMNAGLGFDRAKTRVAVAAKQVDNRARRADLIAGAYAEALKILQRLGAGEYDATGTATNGVTVVTTIKTVPAHDVKHLAAAMAQLANTAARLEAIDDGSSIEHAKSVLGALFDALVDVHGDVPEES